MIERGGRPTAALRPLAATDAAARAASPRVDRRSPGTSYTDTEQIGTRSNGLPAVDTVNGSAVRRRFCPGRERSTGVSESGDQASPRDGRWRAHRAGALRRVAPGKRSCGNVEHQHGRSGGTPRAHKAETSSVRLGPVARNHQQHARASVSQSKYKEIARNGARLHTSRCEAQGSTSTVNGDWSRLKYEA